MASRETNDATPPAAGARRRRTTVRPAGSVPSAARSATGTATLDGRAGSVPSTRIAYWERVRANGFALPDDRPLEDLTAELVGLLGDPDPRARAWLAYPVLATWLASGVYDDLLTGFGDGVSEGLWGGLGDEGSDAVLRRSYSARLLGATIRRDDEAGVVHADAIFRWGDQGASWFVRERDLRRSDRELGPIRAVAHGAELIGALARSRHFGTLELTVLLDVVGDRLLAPTAHRLGHGEGDRLAYAVMTILHRDEIGLEILEPWVERLRAGVVAGLEPGGPVEPLEPVELLDHLERLERLERLDRQCVDRQGVDGLGRAEVLEEPGALEEIPARNTLDFLRALHVQLALGVRGQDTPRDAELFARPPAVRANLLLCVIRALRRTDPGLFVADERGRGH